VPALVREGQTFDYLLGYLSKIKPRNAEAFVPMSQQLGPVNPDEGTYIAQFLFTLGDASIGVSEYYTPQNLNIFYAETTWTPRLEGQNGLKLSLQYTGQRAVGGGPLSDLSENQPLASNLGARVTLSNDLSILNLAYSATGHWGAIISPWGSNPSYTVGAIKNTNRPNERSMLLKYSADFAKFGLQGLSATGVLSFNWNADDPVRKQPLPNQRELDLLVDYHVPDGPFKGVWLRLQRSQLRSSGSSDTTTEWRAIVYAEASLL
jgi:hypothetical protein